MTDRIPPFQYRLTSGSRTALSRVHTRAAQTLYNILRAFGEPGRSSVVLERMPDGADFWDLDDQPLPMMQAAGSSEAMTVEWGRFSDHGDWTVSTLGRGGARPSQPSEIIEWHDGDGTANVYPDEVFDADEAASIFAHFLIDAHPPTQYSLRPTDVTSGKS